DAVGLDGYYLYRRAIGVRGGLASPRAGRDKGARTQSPRRILRGILRYLDDGEPYQCRRCGQLAHLRKGHVARRLERQADGLDSQRGVYCADCWSTERRPDTPTNAKRPGPWLSPNTIRRRIRLLISPA